MNFIIFGLKYAYFLPIGEKICIPPLFVFIPFQSFFPPNMIFGHIFWGQTEKYTPLVLGSVSFISWCRVRCGDCPAGISFGECLLIVFFLIILSLFCCRLSCGGCPACLRNPADQGKHNKQKLSLFTVPLKGYFNNI